MLLSAYFHHAADSMPRLGQCLSVFFPAFAAAGPASRRLICAAAIPAARMAISQAPSGTAPSKVPAPRLLQYVLQMLQVS